MTSNLPPWTRWTYASGLLLLVVAAAVSLTHPDPVERMKALQSEERDLMARVAQAAVEAGCDTVSPVGSAATPTAAPSSPAPSGLASPSIPALSRALLARRLETASAMVIVKGEGGLETGTGFFVSDDLLVTNRHVVEHSRARYVLVVSQSLGSARRAQVFGSTPDAEPGSPDFALLRLADGKAPGWLTLSQDVEKLAEVVAAGYPGMVVSSDSAFERLTQGDLSAAPDLSLTQGVVQSLQQGPAGTGLVVHTASIAKGNSGGPLVDSCGRVVGVNTFINVDRTQSAKISYAINAAALERFVLGLGVSSLKLDPTICRSTSER